MKKIIFLIAISLSLKVSSQYKEAKIVLRSNDTIEGLVKIIFDKTINFKKAKGEKVIFFDGSVVHKIIDKKGKELTYKIINDDSFILVNKPILKGKLEVFSSEYYNHGLPNGFGSGSYTAYYVGKFNASYVKYIPNNFTGKKARKILYNLTSDCTAFLEKIKDKKSIKKILKRSL
jgi:hypothetical protein